MWLVESGFTAQHVFSANLGELNGFQEKFCNRLLKTTEKTFIHHIFHSKLFKVFLLFLCIELLIF